MPNNVVIVFQGLATFARGGAFVQSDNNPATTPGSSGHGTWVRKSGHTFSYTFEKFAFNPILGQPGIFKVSETIDVQDDTYTGESIASFCDINGEACIELGPATSTGKKIR